MHFALWIFRNLTYLQWHTGWLEEWNINTEMGTGSNDSLKKQLVLLVSWILSCLTLTCSPQMPRNNDNEYYYLCFITSLNLYNTSFHSQWLLESPCAQKSSNDENPFKGCFPWVHTDYRKQLSSYQLCCIPACAEQSLLPFDFYHKTRLYIKCIYGLSLDKTFCIFFWVVWAHWDLWLPKLRCEYTEFNRMYRRVWLPIQMVLLTIHLDKKNWKSLDDFPTDFAYYSRT